MRSQAMLLTAAAFIEAGTGLALISMPAFTISLLLGVREHSLEALVVSRAFGASLFALGVACWVARHDRGGRSQYGLLLGMLTYNAMACVVLVFAGLVWRMTGVALWPGVALHAAMAIWFAANLRTLTANGR